MKLQTMGTRNLVEEERLAIVLSSQAPFELMRRWNDGSFVGVTMLK
jgi:hypothetical protein